MPIYEFKCNNCEKLIEKFTMNYDIKTVECDKCGSEANKISSTFMSYHSSNSMKNRFGKAPK
jgi:putative FmdB family regulatory protein